MSLQKYPMTRTIRQATKLFPHQGSSKEARSNVKHLRTNWVKAIDYLGDKWLLADANRVQRRTAK
jgi:hypothetical protein